MKALRRPVYGMIIAIAAICIVITSLVVGSPGNERPDHSAPMPNVVHLSASRALDALEVNGFENPVVVDAHGVVPSSLAGLIVLGTEPPPGVDTSQIRPFLVIVSNPQ